MVKAAVRINLGLIGLCVMGLSCAMTIPDEPIKPIMPSLKASNQPVQLSAEQMQHYQQVKNGMADLMPAWVLEVQKSYPIAVAERLAKQLQAQHFPAYVVERRGHHASIMIGPDKNKVRLLAMSKVVSQALFGEQVSLKTYHINSEDI